MMLRAIGDGRRQRVAACAHWASTPAGRLLQTYEEEWARFRDADIIQGRKKRYTSEPRGATSDIDNAPHRTNRSQTRTNVGIADAMSTRGRRGGVRVTHSPAPPKAVTQAGVITNVGERK